MGNSFLNEIARKVVETYISRNAPVAPIVPQPMPIQPLIGPIGPPIMPIEPPIILPSPVAEEGGVIAVLTPRRGHVTEIDFKQALELEGINERVVLPDPAESVDAIYARYVTQFPIFPELSPREASTQSEVGEQVLETIPITPPPSAPISPASSDPFVVVDLSR